MFCHWRRKVFNVGGRGGLVLTGLLGVGVGRRGAGGINF